MFIQKINPPIFSVKSLIISAFYRGTTTTTSKIFPNTKPPAIVIVSLCHEGGGEKDYFGVFF